MLAHSPPQLGASLAPGDPFLVPQGLSVCTNIWPRPLGSRHRAVSQNLSSGQGKQARTGVCKDVLDVGA